MGQLVQAFFDIALWRRGPQDLPHSKLLAWLVGLVYAVADTAQVVLLGWNVRSAVLLVVIDVLMLCAWVWSLLAFFGRRERFMQTISAIFGAGALITAFDLLISGTELALTGSIRSPDEWVLLRLFIVLLVLGRILQQALERGLLVGMMLTFAMTLSIDAVVQGLVPGM